MSALLDHTHDADATSWVASANQPGTDFPLQNLPFGVFRRHGDERARIGVRIGDEVLDLCGLEQAGVASFEPAIGRALSATSLNALMRLGRGAATSLRHTLFALLKSACDDSRKRAVCKWLVPAADVRSLLPADIGDFTDFYTSLHHATRAGQIARPHSPLFPNFKSIPIAYHGRASSVAVSGTPCRRPRGQTSLDSGYRPSTKLDFELEVGFFVGTGSSCGRPLALDHAEQALFGCCLVNDWSARDIQRWEAMPLGPFLAKSFLTTVSPWIVTLDALAPFRRPAVSRDADAPTLPSELASTHNSRHGAIDISLAVWLQSRQMRESDLIPMRIAHPNFKDQYWNIAQMVAHHSSNGCNLRAADLVSSGTVSGADRDDSGCLLERTVDAREPLLLPTGESRGYLEDGDTVRFTARCESPGFRSIGFGECASEVVGPIDG